MILPNITDKQKEILFLLYRFRFLHRIQIQTLLHHKDHKTINIWLKDLTEKKYIIRIYDNKTQKNILPAKYYISTNGFAFLKSQSTVDPYLLKKLRQEKRRSEKFVEKSLLVADIYLKLLKQDDLKNKDFKFYTGQDFPRNGMIRKVSPDFAYVFKTEGGLEHFVGEIISEKTPRYVIKSRVQKFLDFFGEDEGKPTNIIFISRDELALNLIRKYVYRIVRDDGESNVNVYLTTNEQIKERGPDTLSYINAT